MITTLDWASITRSTQLYEAFSSPHVLPYLPPFFLPFALPLFLVPFSVSFAFVRDCLLISFQTLPLAAVPSKHEKRKPKKAKIHFQMVMATGHLCFTVYFEK